MVPDVGEWAPAIVTAPGLDVPTNLPLTVYKKPRTSTAPRATSAGRTPLSETEMLLHSSAHPKLFYTAREENLDCLDSLRKHYIGVYDPKTGDLQVVPARLLVLRATLRPASTQNPKDENSGEQSASKPLTNARTALGQAFGTRKSQRNIQSRINNTITATLNASQTSSGEPGLDPLAAAVIESMSQGADFASREDMQAAIDQAKPRPPVNLEAETPAGVYNIEELVGLDVLKALNVLVWHDAVQNNEDVPTKSLYVSKRLQQLVQLGDVKKSKVLRYLLLLLDWNRCLTKLSNVAWKLPPREVMKAAVGDDISDFILDNVRKRFAEGIIVNKLHHDKLSMYICALALIVDNSDVDMHDLREDLRLDSKEMAQYFRELGCTISLPTEPERRRMKIPHVGMAIHKMARLRLPLEFPKTRGKAPGRKRG